MKKRALYRPVSLLLFMLFAIASGAEKQAEEPYSWNEAYYIYPELNPGLTALENSTALNSPQAALHFFMSTCRTGNLQQAAHALNLQGIPKQAQSKTGPELAEQLDYLISKRIWIDWDDIPDRPDALDQPPLTGAAGSADSSSPRRLFTLGSIGLNGRDVPIRLQRVRVADSAPIWVFSRQTVEQIPALYRQHGPGTLHRLMPELIRVRMPGNTVLWQWLLTAVLLLISGICGWVTQKTLFLYLKSKEEITWSVRLARTLRLPVAFLAFLVLFYTLVFSMLDFSAPIHSVLNPLLFILIIVDVTWLGIRSMNFGLEEAKNSYLTKRDSSIEDEEHSDARRVVTYFTIGRMFFLFLIFFIGLGVALSRFEIFQALGISLLASAGAASVIVGFAAHRVLGNLIAGVQIAVTQPVRIGDTVHFEGDWSYVEEINYTHLVLRTWDQRRIIVPISYFMTHTIENWSSSRPSLVKPILLHTDYRIDVNRVREKYTSLLKESELWDQNIDPIVQVYECKEETMIIRCLCSAKDASAAWTLHCDLREAMIAWLQQLEDGRYLPHRRIFYYPPQEPPPDETGDQ